MNLEGLRVACVEALSSTTEGYDISIFRALEERVDEVLTTKAAWMRSRSTERFHCILNDMKTCLDTLVVGSGIP